MGNESSLKILLSIVTPPSKLSLLHINLLYSDLVFCLNKIVKFSGLPVPHVSKPFLWQNSPSLLTSISPIISRIILFSSVVVISNLDPGPFE